MKMGRPTLYTPELAEAIGERLAKGEPLARICADDDMPGYSTVRRWEEEREDFRAISARTRDLGCDFMADDCVRIADDPSIDAQNKRVMVDTRLRLLGMWNKRYNPKIDVNHGGQPGNPITSLIQQVTGTTFAPEDSEE